MTSYYKGAINSEGQLSITDPTGYPTMGDAKFCAADVKRLRLMDCRPVVVQVVREYDTTTEVIAIEPKL